MSQGFGITPASHSFSRRVNNVLFRNITFNEVTQFDTQGFRPYTANTDTKSIVDNAVNIISERQFSFGRFTPDTVGSISDNMLAMSGHATGNVGIDNGWKSPRYMFSINVDVEMSSGGAMNYVVTGFTDTNNIHVNGNHVSIDPNIILHITNISEGRTINGGLFISRSDQILTRNHYMNDLSVNGTEFRSQRPVDVFNTMTSNMFKQDSNTSFTNTESSLGTPVFGSRFNNIPNYYSANIFNSYVEAASNNADTVGEGYQPQVAELTNTKPAAEAYISNNKFLEFLNANNDSFTMRTSFRWADLLSIDANIMDRLHLNRLSDRESFLPSTGLITANTNNRTDIMGQIASVLATSIPALANKFNLQIVGFIANNTFGNHHVQIDPSTQSFNPLTTRMHADQFAAALPSQVFDSLFTNMQLVYEMSVYCQINSETFIRLNVHGLGSEDFLIPTFAESLFTPIVTNQVSTIDSISDTVKFVTGRINEEASSGKALHAADTFLKNIADNKTPGSFGSSGSSLFGNNNNSGFTTGTSGF